MSGSATPQAVSSPDLETGARDPRKARVATFSAPPWRTYLRPGHRESRWAAVLYCRGCRGIMAGRAPRASCLCLQTKVAPWLLSNARKLAAVRARRARWAERLAFPPWGGLTCWLKLCAEFCAP